MHRVLSVTCLTILVSAAAPVLPAHAGGNVTAVVQKGVLVIRGDGAETSVEVTTDGAPAGGLRVDPFVGTTVNGSAAPLDFPDVPGGVRAGLGGGEDDFVASGAAPFPGPIDVDMGGGDDNVSFRTITAPACDIGLGTGRDDVGLDTSSCDELTLNGGGGDDVVMVFRGAYGTATFDMGAGPDFVRFSNTAFSGPVNAGMGGGDDFLQVTAESAFASTLTVAGGTGADAFAEDGTNSFAVPPTFLSVP